MCMMGIGHNDLKIYVCDFDLCVFVCCFGMIDELVFFSINMNMKCQMIEKSVCIE